MVESIEWDIRVPLVSNVYVLIDVLVVLLVVSGGLAGLIMFVTDFTDVYGVLRLFIIADGLMILLLYSVMGFVFINRFQLIYRLNHEGVLVRVGEFESSLNRMAWTITGFIQKHGVSSGRVFSMINEELFVPWDKVSRAVFDNRRRVASLINGNRPLMRVYCTKMNYEQVFAVIESYLPEPEE